MVVSGRQTGSDKVDVVYLWVDGADPAWQAGREQAYARWAPRQGADLAVFGNAAGRYRDNGELRFNLRALEQFFPDHGHVYLVTDRQVPDWLRPRRGLTVVDHRTLLAPQYPQVYDSGHIESYLHHIPGLSERFFYLNDDVFFGAEVDLASWFGTRLKVFAEVATVPAYTALQAQETALVNASLLSRDWLAGRYPAYRHDPRVYAHAPRPMLKSATHALERLAPELFAQVRSTVFRSWRVPPIVPDLVPRWMVQMGYAEQRTLDPLHISTGTPQAAAQLAGLAQSFGHLPFFCLNDTCDEATSDDPRLLQVTQTLAQLLPTPSSFEWAGQAEQAPAAALACAA